MPTLDETHVRTESCLRCGKRILVTQSSTGKRLELNERTQATHLCASTCTPINLQDGGRRA